MPVSQRLVLGRYNAFPGKLEFSAKPLECYYIIALPTLAMESLIIAIDPWPNDHLMDIVGHLHGPLLPVWNVRDWVVQLFVTQVGGAKAGHQRLTSRVLDDDFGLIRCKALLI